MQAQGNILERTAQAYVASRRVRVFCVLAVLVSACLLFVLAGGFPPYAWRLLGQTLPQLSTLLALRGPAVSLALLALLLQSAAILIAWYTLLLLSWKMLAYWRYERCELRKFAADAEEAQYQAEELHEQYADDEEQAVQPVRWQSGSVSLPVTRRRVIYPLSPLPESAQDEEEEVAQSAQDDDAEEPFFLEEEEEENEMNVYRDEDDDEEAAWPAPARSPAPGTTLYNQRQAAQGGADGGYHTSYGRILPFASAPSAGALPHLTSAPYNRVSLPHSVAAPSAQPAPAAKLPTVAPARPGVARPSRSPAAPQRSEPTQLASASAKMPAVAPQRSEPTQLASASAKMPVAMPPAPESEQAMFDPLEESKRVPILPLAQVAHMAKQWSPAPEQAASQPGEPPQASAALTQSAKQPAVIPQRPASVQPSSPRPGVPKPAMQAAPLQPAQPVALPLSPMQAPVPPGQARQATVQLPLPSQTSAPRAVPEWPGTEASAGQPSAMQSLVELISTVPMEPPALVELASSLPTELAAAPVELASTIPMNSPVPVELASTIPMNSPAREPIPLTPPPTRAEPDPRQAATLQLVVSTGLDVGLKRRGKPNEDSLLALQNTRFLRGNACPVGLFVVADGMGGHENGQEASNLVTQSLSKSVMPTVIYGPTDDNYAELLAEGVHHANLEVYQRNRQASVDMGTTIVAALVINTTAYIVSAGDSRVYLYRASSGLTQITRDHSTVARLVENGLIKPEEVYTHPRRNEIYRSLGHHPSEDLDKFILALQPDDVLMLCSDGLWEMVRDEHIQEIIANTASQPKQTSAALVQAALDGGGKDNISVIVVSVKATTGTQTAWAG